MDGPPPIAPLSDEFDGSASPGRWRSHGAVDLVPELWNDAAAFNRTVIADRPTDLAAEFDYVRFDRPRVPDALRGARLSDYRVPAADLVAAFAP